MINKLWVVLAANFWVSASFIFSTWALVDTYRLGEWGFFALFAISLPFYIHKLAHMSTVYDAAKRRGDI